MCSAGNTEHSRRRLAVYVGLSDTSIGTRYTRRGLRKTESEPPIFGKHYPVQHAPIGQRRWWEEPFRRALMTMFGGVREMDWFLCKNPGRTGRVTCELLGLVRIDALDRSASSETLLPKAKSVKNQTFTRRFLSLFHTGRQGPRAWKMTPWH